MPPKSSSGKEKDIADEDEVLQAVILADSFNKRFKPLTVGKPRCLLPICNATLLDWTFESLALAGVQEIFVICRSYADQVKAAIRDSKWSKPSSGIKIVPIVTAKETFSPGDAMRDIYTHQIITSDFVLVTGDLVSNVRIDEVVRAHKERRRTNKDAIMTIVVKEAGAVHRTRSRGVSGVYVLDPNTSECLHYEPVLGYPPASRVTIPREILAEHPEVEIRNDFMDCSIDVCSVEVPSLFQDNFDYGDIRRDFVYGVLTSDLLMKNIYCYVAKDGYAARVADTRSYDAVSKDILSRWTFPLVPDNNHPGGHSYEHLRGNKYIAKDNSVSLSRTCKIGNNTLIGSHTTIAENATIHASVIGQRCTIGAGATLRDAYIFDDTEVGEGCFVGGSIVGSHVKLGKGVRVPNGCIIADGVVIGEGARLRNFERVSKKRGASSKAVADGSDGDDEDDEDSELEEIEAHQEDAATILGKDSNALVWPRGSPADDEDELDEREHYNNLRLMRIGDDASDLELSDAGSNTSSDSETESESSSIHALSRTSSMTSVSGPSLSHSDLSAQTSAIHSLSSAAAETEFRSEVAQSLERAFDEGHSVENAAVELKTLRMASNVPLRRVREAVVGAIVDRVPLVPGDASAQRTEIAKMVRRWGPLIDKIGGVDPVETIEALQYHCAAAGPRQGLFAQMLVALYQQDLVDEDDIRAWHKSPAAKGEGVKPGSPLAEGLQKCWEVGAKLLEQLSEESEEESEEEEAPKATVKAAAKEEGESDSEESEDDSVRSEDSAPSKPAPSSALRPPASSTSLNAPPAKSTSQPVQPSVPAKAAPAPAAAPTPPPAPASAAAMPAQSASTSVPKTVPRVAKAESSEESSEDDDDDESGEDEDEAGP
ncbi:nucleotide-diphospho-sugar transferase [Polyporus arcularius HHB13444]|uniref:Translation initiation factor eIF2B subunit epsilon n=1 Tax=Polyporus arcularius HHB13444 TaxID=1314778 RepID=A0A5C3P1G8_9APHY|nr:nucleotide-diphospho-sugar transferase [Polyporus arcularius HHB13444]